MKKRLFFVGLLFVLLLSACAGEMQEIETQMPEDLPPEAALAAQEALSAMAGASIEEIEILEWERMEWPDACLGLAEPEEVCAQVITPGWRVVMEVNGEQYVFRTDESGSTVRVAETP